MKRRSKAGGKPSKVRRRSALNPKGRSARKAMPRRGSAPGGQDTEVARLTRERDEALGQQAATADVLRIISSSPGNLDTVLETILANATRLCEANFGVLLLYEGAQFRVAAAHNPPPAFAELRRRQPEIRSSSVLARFAVTKQSLHIADCTEDPSYKQGDDDFVAFVDLCGVRTLLGTPLLKKGELIGMVGLYRQQVRLFTDQQVEVVRNFAAQAVIAIENARMLNELRESLQQQTATSEVLQVISSSPGDLEPVFSTVLEKAVRTCEAKFGTLYLYERGKLRLAAARDVPPAFAKAQGAGPFDPAPGGMLDLVIKTGRTVHLPDLAATQAYLERHPIMVQAVDLGGIRTVVGVPMLKDSLLVGLIGVFRQEVRPFTEKQVALLTNFAAQAVIAIENARLLNELRESLQEQTATSEVLQVISSSPGDLAASVCDHAGESRSYLRRHLWQYLSLGWRRFAPVATHNTPLAYAEARRRSPFRPDPKNIFGRMVATKTVVHVPDAAELREQRQSGIRYSRRTWGRTDLSGCSHAEGG